MPFARYAIFAVPDGAFFSAGSDWLGWNSETGTDVSHPDLDGLPAPAPDLTATPRKYGFHGTIKPPFRLIEGARQEDLENALSAFCAVRAPIEIPRLVIRRLGGFVACVPDEPVESLTALAAATVAGLDPFRAPPAQAELDRRRRVGLSASQEKMLQYWGYPYVFDEFRFHLTLSGRLDEPQAEALAARLTTHFAPVLPTPYRVDSLGLLGEAPDGRFHLLHRYTLAG